MKLFLKIIIFILLTIVLFFICKPGFVYLSNHAIGIPVAKYANKGFPLVYYNSEADLAPGQYGDVTVNAINYNTPGWALTSDNIFDWIIVALLSLLIMKILIKIKMSKNEKSI